MLIIIGCQESSISLRYNVLIPPNPNHNSLSLSLSNKWSNRASGNVILCKKICALLSSLSPSHYCIPITPSNCDDDVHVDVWWWWPLEEELRRFQTNRKLSRLFRPPSITLCDVACLMVQWRWRTACVWLRWLYDDATMRRQRWRYDDNMIWWWNVIRWYVLW